MTWGMLVGGACLAGIGFTMALFLNGLAFLVPEYSASEAAGKIGTLLGSWGERRTWCGGAVIRLETVTTRESTPRAGLHRRAVQLVV